MWEKLMDLPGNLEYTRIMQYFKHYFKVVHILQYKSLMVLGRVRPNDH